MIEYSIKALVLDSKNIGEFDKLVYLYTEELGRVAAKIKSARKITSKLRGHLEPFNFIRARLVEKKGLWVADALVFDKIKISKNNLDFLLFVKDMTFDFQQDKKLWRFIRKKILSYRLFLKILGFDPDFSRCQICNRQQPAYFSKNDQVFFCQTCAVKIPKNELILIEAEK